MESQNNTLSFRGQREDEELILLLHRHPWALAKAGLIIALGLVLIALMFVYFQFSRPAIWTLFILGPILLIYGGYAWFIWWNTIYLLTNQRIITISQYGLWSRRIEDYALEKIQSVASDTQGPAGTLLNFGVIMLAIMGIRDRVTLPYVEEPYLVQDKILSTARLLSEESALHSHASRRRIRSH